MSSYHGNDAKCPYCGLRYRELRTGLTYSEVYLWYLSGSDDSREWKYKRRRTILGKWHQHKLELWAHHKDFDCPERPENRLEEAVPF